MRAHSFNGTSPAWAGFHVDPGAIAAATVIVVIGVLLIALRKRIAALSEARRQSHESEGTKAYCFQRLARSLRVASIVVVILGVGFGFTSFAF